MIKAAYEYTYFCFYKLSQSVKRRIDNNHEIASTLLSVTVLIWSGIFLMILSKVDNVDSITHYQVIFLIISIGAYYFNTKYFIRQERYKDIVRDYNEKANISFSKFFAFLLYFTSFAIILFVL